MWPDWRGLAGYGCFGGESRLCLRWKSRERQFSWEGGERREVSLCAWAGGTDVVSYFFFSLSFIFFLMPPTRFQRVPPAARHLCGA